MARSARQTGPVRRAQKCEELGGLPELARQLREGFPALTWPASARTLETELGKLDRGITVWWRNKPEHAQSLAQLLEVELVDLGLAGPGPAQHVIDFPAFPGMPPLDVRRAGRWQLGCEKPVAVEPEPSRLASLEEWLAPAPGWRRPPHEWNWLCMEDDFERDLLFRTLEVAGHYEVVVVPALADAAVRLASPKPLIVKVEAAAGSDADFDALAHRSDSVGLLVIAPYALPLRPSMGGPLSWERQSLSGRQRVAFDASAGGGGWSNVKPWQWQRFPDWRARFLRWLEHHFQNADKDTLYSAAGAQAWFDRFDPREEWFHTAFDLLSVCLNFESERKLPAEHDAHAGRKLLATLQRGWPAFDGPQLKELSLARWSHRDSSWSDSLSLDAWLPLSLRRPSVVTEDDLAPIVEGRTVAQRKLAAQAMSRRSQRADPAALLAGGLLKSVAGKYDFQHRSLANLLVRDHLLACMAEGSLSDWAWACFDAQRCRLVDAALDALSWQDMQALAGRVLDGEMGSLEVLGASESIFCAVSRRIVRGGIDSPLPDVLMRLAHGVVARLNMNEAAWSLPRPWSFPTDSENARLDWISACWAWSLMPAPTWAGEANWLFPGWSECLPEVAWWLADLWPSADIDQLPRCWQTFFQVADECVKHLEAPAFEVPRILKMACLMKAAHGGWDAQPSWWDGLLHMDNVGWLDETLIDGFAEVLPQESAKRLWPAYLRWEASGKTGIGGWHRYLWRVRRWLLESLPVPWAVDSLDLAGRIYLASCPETLPPAWRGPLLLSLKTQWDTIPFGQEEAFLQRFGPAIVGELEQLLGCGMSLGAAAAPLIWQWKPRRACDLLQHADALSPEAWTLLFQACPVEHLSAAISALKTYPERFNGPERAAWAQQKLPGSGGLAPSLIKLLADV